MQVAMMDMLYFLQIQFSYVDALVSARTQSECARTRTEKAAAFCPALSSASPFDPLVADPMRAYPLVLGAPHFTDPLPLDRDTTTSQQLICLEWYPSGPPFV